MTQDQRWQIRFDEVMNFMEKEHRKPSKLCYNNRFATLAYVFGLDHPHKAASACCWSTIL